MEKLAEAMDKILMEVTRDDPEVRTEYLKHFQAQLNPFCASMAIAVLKWGDLDVGSERSKEHAFISALVHAAIGLHVQSMKLFLSGHLVAAGNLFRQVVEAISLALLCSGHGSNVLKRFIAGTYSTNKAVDQLCRHYKTLNLRKDGIQALRASQSFYHHYSHVSQMTLAAFMSFAEKGVYVGAAFDVDKIDAYRKEFNGRVSLAKVFPNFIDAVNANIEQWDT